MGEMGSGLGAKTALFVAVHRRWSSLISVEGGAGTRSNAPEMPQEDQTKNRTDQFEDHPDNIKIPVDLGISMVNGYLILWS
ncbi:MAG TPA: hypothetical protein VJ914_02630 [Pseudonocardiaceae bacterium]|nr:hypothetical protein [Pseudonocardiaceae bacterium]